MINAIIRASLENRAVVLLLAAMLTAIGAHSYLRTPVDALPDLSDVQVIVRTSYPGQAPRLVEDQVTYPLTTALLSVPGATSVRGYSFYGDSFVNVLFEDGTDPYWARSRVLEYLSQAAARLPLHPPTNAMMHPPAARTAPSRVNMPGIPSISRIGSSNSGLRNWPRNIAAYMPPMAWA